MKLLKGNRRINRDLVFNLKLLCVSLIFGGYMLIVFALPLLLITALPILALLNILIAAAGIILEISGLTEKAIFRMISDICMIAGFACFVFVICRIFV